MTGEDYAWIVTEQALEAPNVPTGILGLKLVNATSEKNHIKDSMYVSYLLYWFYIDHFCCMFYCSGFITIKPY